MIKNEECQHNSVYVDGAYMVCADCGVRWLTLALSDDYKMPDDIEYLNRLADEERKRHGNS